MYEVQFDKQGNKAVLRITKGKSIAELKAIHSFLNSCEWEVEEVNRLSDEQRKLIWALCGELTDYTGYTAEEMRVVLQNMFCASRDISYFSLNMNSRDVVSCDVATEFIQFIIEFAVMHGFNVLVPEGGNNKKLRHVREVVPEIRRYVLACLLSKTCALCGTRENIDLHHYTAIGSIGYENDDGLQTPFLSLCREHHTIAHNMTKQMFEDRYHLYGIWLTENIVRALLPVYAGHFKKFRRNINEDN